MIQKLSMLKFCLSQAKIKKNFMNYAQSQYQNSTNQQQHTFLFYIYLYDSIL